MKIKSWYFWAGLLVSGIFLYIALRGLKLEQVGEVIRSAQLGWLLLVIPIDFTSLWFRSVRWQLLLRPVKTIPVKAVFPIMAIGYMGNNIYPARAGELLRAVILKQRQDIPIPSSLASIIVERILDGVVILGFIFFNFSELNQLTSDSSMIASIRSLALWGSLAFMSALLFLVLAARFPAGTERLLSLWVNRLMPNKWRDKVLQIAQRFFLGISALHSVRSLSMVLGSSLVIWLLETSVYWVVMLAFPFEISFFGLMLMNGLLNLTTTIPSAPGYVGTFDAPGIALLSAYGIARTLAAGYVLVLHAALWLPVTLLGAYFFSKEGLNWGKIMEKAKAEKEQA